MMETYLTSELAKIERQGLYRQVRSLESAQEPVVTLNGARVIQLSSNNYLGLANHPRLKTAAREALETYGTGSGASRLITGNFALYEDLEIRLARFKKTEAAVVFPTGYQANFGTIPTLMGPKDLIFSDALNHACIVDGCRLSGARIFVYPHRDVDGLEKLLRNAPPARNRLIITDGVFSMDGTIAPLPDLVSLARRYDCWLMVDDAHATGVLGQRGGGTGEHFQMETAVDIHMGTFSKALGSLGGYIAGSRKLKELLYNQCRSLMYTTGLPPAVLAVNQEAIALVEGALDLREALRKRADFFRKTLLGLGFRLIGRETPIIPVIIGGPEQTMAFSRELFSQGVLAHGIRPPTVPEGQSRIRISVMANHTWEDLDRALNTIEKTGKKFGII